RKLERERPLQGGRHGAVLLDTEEHLLLEGERVGGRLCHIPYGDRAGTFPVEAQAARLLRILGGLRLFLRRLLRGPPARGALVATAARKSQERRSQQKGPKRSAMHGYVHLHFPIVGFTGRVTAHDGSGSFVPSLGKKQSGGGPVRRRPRGGVSRGHTVPQRPSSAPLPEHSAPRALRSSSTPLLEHSAPRALRSSSTPLLERSAPRALRSSRAPPPSTPLLERSAPRALPTERSAPRALRSPSRPRRCPRPASSRTCALGSTAAGPAGTRIVHQSGARTFSDHDGCRCSLVGGGAILETHECPDPSPLGMVAPGLRHPGPRDPQIGRAHV